MKFHNCHANMYVLLALYEKKTFDLKTHYELHHSVQIGHKLIRTVIIYHAFRVIEPEKILAKHQKKTSW